MYNLTRLEDRLTAESNEAVKHSQLRALYNFTRLLHPWQNFQSILMFKLGLEIEIQILNSDVRVIGL